MLGKKKEINVNGLEILDGKCVLSSLSRSQPCYSQLGGLILSGSVTMGLLLGMGTEVRAHSQAALPSQSPAAGSGAGVCSLTAVFSS